MQSHDAEYRESGEGWARTPKPAAMTVPLSDARLTAIRERHALKVSMGLIRADDNEGMLLAEIERLQAKVEERRVELRDRRTEDLNLRGLLAPNGLPRRVPIELGASLVPAVEWLLAELAKTQGQVRAVERQHRALGAGQ